MNSPRDELLRLVDRQIEGRLSEDDEERLAQLLRSDEDLVAAYTQYMCVHGQLFWDAGLSSSPSVSTTIAPTNAPSPTLVRGGTSEPESFERNTSRGTSRRLVAVCTAIAAVLVGWIAISRPPVPGETFALRPPEAEDSAERMEPDATVAVSDNAAPPKLTPLELRHRTQQQPEANLAPISVAQVSPRKNSLPAVFEDDMVVAEVDRLIQTSWKDHNIEPSALAADSEWIRRVYLTMVGRVPTLKETQSFLASKSPRKRLQLINNVTAAPERASHFAVVWTNLLIGRTQRPGVNRESLFEFLSNQFASNRPWIDTVDELITATGRNDKKGATNFLLAHLNNEATPATAVTARLFLGEQISCVQCHDHPFSKDVRQQEYWALNAFFKDTQKQTVDLANAASGGNMKDTPWRLVDRRREDEDRMTYFETRNGLKKAVLPAYDGSTVSRDSDVNRREELARLLAADSDAKVARAMVNRMWDHFFGYGFTNPVDDMGPHAAVSHPELLDLLTEAFVKSDYNMERLMKWIAGSRAWQSSSQTVASNVSDDPASGVAPLFSHVYVRRMTPEQVYESIRVAIRSAAGKPVEAGKVHSDHRREWVGQFTQAYDTDENDESLDFEGTIAQAMVMMNGVEVDVAIHQATEAIVSGGGDRVKSSGEALNRVALAMLNRKPTTREKAVFRNHHRRLSQQSPGGMSMVAAVEDMMWAYLNSSEFVMVH